MSPHTSWYRQNIQAWTPKSRWAEWNHLETQAKFNNETFCTKRFPITPNGVLGVAPYLLFTTSALCGTIHKYKKYNKKQQEQDRTIFAQQKNKADTSDRTCESLTVNWKQWRDKDWHEDYNKGEDNFQLLCTIRWHKQFLNFPFEFRERSHVFKTSIEPVPNQRSPANHTVCANKFYFFTINMISVPSAILMLGITDWN